MPSALARSIRAAALGARDDARTVLGAATSRPRPYEAPQWVIEEDARMTTTRRAGTGKRELLKSAAGTTFTKRRADGTFKEHDAVGRSLTTDRRRKAKTKVASGHGDRGDR
jgi:hypothetical protein